MNVEAIDWSKAPDDATHYCTDNGMWYKFTSDNVYASEGREDSWSLSVFDESFIPRPVSSKQIKIAAEAGNEMFQQYCETGNVLNCSNEPRPPLGLTPKSIWEEQMQHQRRQDIHAAMQRYIEAGKEIPNNWLEELLELNNAIGSIKAQEVLATAKQNIKEEMDVEQPDNSNEGWIEWGKNEMPSGLQGKIIEREYNDGVVLKGYVEDYTWNDDNGTIDDNIVKRYRVVGEAT